MVIYGSMRAEFMETKHTGHIHRHGTPICGKIVVYVSKPININKQMLPLEAVNIVIFDFI